LKLPTTDTAASGSPTGSAKVTRTVPALADLAVLINFLLSALVLSHPHTADYSDSARTASPGGAERAGVSQNPVSTRTAFDFFSAKSAVSPRPRLRTLAFSSEP
jgi:hypothetical protein